MCTTEKGADGLLVVQGRPESFPNVGVHMQSFIRQQLLRHMDMEKLRSLLKRSWVEGRGRQLLGCGAGSAICSTWTCGPPSRPTGNVLEVHQRDADVQGSLAQEEGPPAGPFLDQGPG